MDAKTLKTPWRVDRIDAGGIIDADGDFVCGGETFEMDEMIADTINAAYPPPEPPEPPDVDATIQKIRTIDIRGESGEVSHVEVQGVADAITLLRHYAEGEDDG